MLAIEPIESDPSRRLRDDNPLTDEACQRLAHARLRGPTGKAVDLRGRECLLRPCQDSEDVAVEGGGHHAKGSREVHHPIAIL